MKRGTAICVFRPSKFMPVPCILKQFHFMTKRLLQTKGNTLKWLNFDSDMARTRADSSGRMCTETSSFCAAEYYSL